MQKLTDKMLKDSTENFSNVLLPKQEILYVEQKCYHIWKKIAKRLERCENCKIWRTIGNTYPARLSRKQVINVITAELIED